MKLRPSLSLSPDAFECPASSSQREEWRSLCQVLGEAVECAIDHAARSCSEPDDLHALDHLRSFARASFAGTSIAADKPSLLHAVGILLATLAEPRADEGAPAQHLSLVGRRVRQLAELPYKANAPQRVPSLLEARRAAKSASGPVRPQRRTSARRASSLSVAA